MNKSKIPVDQRQALGLLLDDHRQVKALFKKFENASSIEDKQTIAQQTCLELAVHAQVEEEIFYPALREVSKKLEKMLNEAEVEHASAKALIAQIESAPEKESLEALYTVLSEYVSHHVEEEENEMFTVVIEEKLKLRDVAEQMQARKEALTAELTEAAV